MFISSGCVVGVENIVNIPEYPNRMVNLPALKKKPCSMEVEMIEFRKQNVSGMFSD